MDSDRRALDDLVGRYTVAADARDGEAVAALFTDDGRILMHEHGIAHPATMALGTPAAITAGINGLRRYVVTMHFIGQHVVDIDGPDTATGVTYCLANHVYEVEGGRVNRMVALRYFDDYARLPEGWRFVERRLVYDWVEYRPTS